MLRPHVNIDPNDRNCAHWIGSAMTNLRFWFGEVCWVGIPIDPGHSDGTWSNNGLMINTRPQLSQ